MLHSRTLVTLGELEDTAWFTHVGEPRSDSVVVLDSWSAAIDSCGSIDWENFCLETANRHRSRLTELSPERFCVWNQIVSEVKPLTEQLVNRKIGAVVEAHRLPKVFSDTVRWDVLHLAMEAEYADVLAPGFYAGLAYWYKAGRFPCGWSGEAQSGKLVIY